MKTLTIELYPLVFFILGIVSVFLTAFTALIKFHIGKLKPLLIRMELYTVIMLVTMGLTYVFDGMAGKSGYAVVLITNTCCLFMNCLIVYCYNEYLTILFMSKGHFKELPKPLKAGYMLTSLWIVYLCISMFTGWSFTIDENNFYQTGDLYFLSGIFAVIIISVQMCFIIAYRQHISKKLGEFLVAACMFLMLASVIHIITADDFITQAALFSVLASLFGFTLMEQNEELHKAAYTDPQSGLPNAYGFIYEIDCKIRKGTAKNFDAFYIEADSTGMIKKSYGKEQYDELLRKYCEFFCAWKNKNEIFGILGGNFFLALVERSRTEEFLKHLVDVPLEISINDENITVHVGAVAGGYEIQENTKIGGVVMIKITTAITYAKSVAKKTVAFLDDETERKINEEKAMMDAIREGLKNEEFEPFYQPKVNTETYTLCGSEALVRWRKDGQLIPPMKFIPLIEKSGLICVLDFYMLDRVCKDMREWLDKGLTPPCVSVNFSRKNLSNPEFTKEIYDTLKKYDIPPTHIQVEVTETIDEYPLSALRAAVDSLHGYGISVAIDDFGTGSSSISLLKEITFDVLKIDKTFIDFKDEKEKKLLSYIIEMSKAINISVIAEGVEDIDHVHILQGMDCADIQGFVFDKPLEKSEYEKRIEKREYSLQMIST